MQDKERNSAKRGSFRRSTQRKNEKRGDAPQKRSSGLFGSISKRLSLVGNSDKSKQKPKQEKKLSRRLPGSASTSIFSWGDDTVLKFEDQGAKYRFTSIAANASTAVALTDDGHVLGQGSNEDGQLSAIDGDDAVFLGASDPVPLPSVIFAKRKIVQAAVGSGHCMFLTSEGFVITSGRNDFGQLGHSRDREPYRVPARFVQGLDKETAVHVACAADSSFILTARGKVFSFGLGRHGMLGLGDEGNRSEPKLVSGALSGAPVAQIVAGAHHVVALSVTGRAFAWGSNASFQLGTKHVDSKNDFSSLPLRVPFDQRTNIVSVAAGSAHSVFLTKKGRVFGCGSNDHSQLGKMASDKVLVAPPQEMESLSELDGRVVQVVCGDNVTAALLESGVVFSLGTLAGKSETSKQKGKSSVSAQAARLSLSQTNGGPPAAASKVASCVFRIHMGGKVIYGIASEKSIFEERVKFATQRTAISTWSASSLFSEAQSSKKSRRGSMRTFHRQNKIDIFDMHTLNASFLIPPAESSTGDMDTARISSSGLDIAGLVRALEQLQGSLRSNLKGDQFKEHLRERMMHVVSQLDDSAPFVQCADQLRAYLVMLLVPFSDILRKEYEPLLLALQRLPTEARQMLLDWIANEVPSDIFQKNLVWPALRVLDITYLQHHRFDESCRFLCLYLKQLFKANLQRRSSVSGSRFGFEPLAATDFYSEQLAAYREVDIKSNFGRWQRVREARRQVANMHNAFRMGADARTTELANSFTLFDYPFLLSADAKRKVLKLEDEKSMLQNLVFSQLFLGEPYFVLEVDRNHILRDTVDRLMKIDPQEMKKPLRVKFKGEDGLDAGGVKKEFFQLLSAQLFSVEYGMFEPYEEKDLIWFRKLSKSKQRNDTDFTMVGALIGLAIYNSTLLDVNFPVLLWRILLDKMPDSPGLDELAELDPAYARSLRQMLDYKEDDFEDVFCATFEVTRKLDGKTRNVELMQGGADLSVTRENVEEYVKLVCKYHTVDSIRDYAKPLLDGFHLVIARGLASLSLFQPSELELAAVGSRELDFDDLEYAATYEGGYTAKHPTIFWFWRVAKAMSAEEKQKLMSFATGSPRAPVGGLKSTVFKIQRNGPDSDRLVSSSTCFNTLLLPDYASEKKLKAKLLQSIEHNMGFGNE